MAVRLDDTGTGKNVVSSRVERPITVDPNVQVKTTDMGSPIVATEQALTDKLKAMNKSYYSDAGKSTQQVENASDNSKTDTTGSNSNTENKNQSATSEQQQIVISPSYSSTATNYLQEAYNKMLAGYDDQVNAIKQGYSDIAAQRTAAANAAIEQSRLQLQNAYDQAKSQYETQQAEQDYLKRVNADNLILTNTAAGNLGGIGQAQYSAQQASYDNQMLTIKLEQINLKANLDSQIAQLEAEGQYELANQLAELGVAQLQDLQTQYNNLQSLSYSYANAIDSNNLTARQLDFNEAMSLLQQGVVSANSAAALGLTTEQAQQIANYYKTAQDLDLATSQANLYSNYVSGDGYASGTETVADGTTKTASDGSTLVYDSSQGGWVVSSVGNASSTNTKTKASSYPSERVVSSLATSGGTKLNYNEQETMMNASVGMTDAEVKAAKALYDTAASTYTTSGNATSIPGLDTAYSKFQSTSTYKRDGALSTNGLIQYLSLYNISNGDPAVMAQNAQALASQQAIDKDDFATILYICDIGEKLA